MDLFARERYIYDEAMALLEKEHPEVTIFQYAKLADEYGKLLKQLQHYYTFPTAEDYANSESELSKNRVHFDMLTGIFNRRYLHENLERVLLSMSRIDDVLSVMLIDIDFLKGYNDFYGFGAGDNCLKNVAEALKSCLFRGQDFVARFGGEEFMAILPHTREAGARLVAERMLEEVEQLGIPHEHSLVTNMVTVSIGLVTAKKTAETWVAADFFKRAEEALQLAKTQGRNQYAFLDF